MKLPEFVHKKGFQIAAPAVLTFGCGITVGFFIGKRSKKEEEPEVHVLPQPGETLLVKGNELNLLIPDDTEFEVVEVTSGKAFVSDLLENDEEEIEIVSQSVFAESDDDWDYDREIANRVGDRPYVLHKDEFYAEEKYDEGYSQTTLTYYAGDNIMVDQDDVPVYNHETIVGHLMFGHGSGDPNVFYVRNETRKAEYEILFDKGLYSREVLGLEIENNARVEDLKHSGHYRKFRLED